MQLRNLAKAVTILWVVFAVAFGVSAVALAKTDGTLRVAVKSIGNLDPHLTQSDFDFAVLSQVYNTLVRIGKNGLPIPDLATKWENPDDTTWLFHLRQGVLWHDGNQVFPAGKGREVTAADVKYSFDRVLDPDTKSPFAGALQSIKKVEVVDPYTVKLTTAAPDPFLLDAIRLAGIAIVPKEAVQKLGAAGFARTPIGSGPFKFVEFVPDDHVKLVRNDKYWKKPNLKEVVFRIVPDGSVAVLSLETGDVDVALDIPTTEVARLSANKKILLYRSQLGYYRGIGFNVKKAPFDDVNVRKAISMAVDLDGAVANVFGKLAIRAYGQVGPGLLGYDLSLKNLWKHDPAGAKKLLAQAGWTPGPDGILTKNGQKLRVELKTLNEPGRVKVVTIMATQLKQIGIDAQVVTQETGTWVNDLVSGNTSMFMDFAFSGPTGLHALFHSSTIGASNTHFYVNPKADALLDQGSKTLDTKKREKVWKEAQRLIMTDFPVIPLYFEFGYSATSSRVKGFMPQRWTLNLVGAETNVSL